MDTSSRARRELAFTRKLLTGSYILLAAQTLYLARERFWWIQVFAGLLAAWVILWWLTGVFRRRGWPLGWFVSLAFMNLVVFVPELGLRIAHFRYEPGIQFGYPRPSEFWRFVPDAELFWKLDPRSEHANALGFPGRDIREPKPSGSFRILFLGDSCTQQGYPLIIERLLNGTKAVPSIESVGLAVSGYTSHQGRILAKKYGARLEPDLVFVYFGWNDHWLAYDAIDAKRRVRASFSRADRVRQRVYFYSRMAQLGTKVVDRVKGRTEKTPIDEVRVPPGQYRANLRSIASVFQALKIPVVFVTAPTSHARLGVPDYLIAMKYSRDKEKILRLHKRYNAIVREVASSTSSRLLDLELELGALSGDEMLRLFKRDGIHYRPAGLDRLAERFVAYMKSQSLLP